MKNRKTYGCVVICKTLTLLFTIFLMGESYAVTNQLTGLNKLAHYADVIAVGEYVDVSSAWEKKKIYTTATFKIEKSIKGNVNNTIKIKALGGTALHPRLNTLVSMNVSNGVSFNKGNSAVVFLKKNNDDTYQIVGMSKGTISIVTDDVGARYMAGGIKKIAASKNEGTGNTIIHQENMKLEQFVAYINSLLQDGK